MLFNIIFKQYLNIFIRNFVLCIQIRFVSTEKTTRIASRASCLIDCQYPVPTNFLETLFMTNKQINSVSIGPIKLMALAIFVLSSKKPLQLFWSYMYWSNLSIYVVLTVVKNRNITVCSKISTTLIIILMM